MPKTLFDKIWDAHVITKTQDGFWVLYIDRHLVHEVTSPQAFEGLRSKGRKVLSPSSTLAMADHNVPTSNRDKGIIEPKSKLQVDTLLKNVEEFGVEVFDMTDSRQGIVHVVGPEQGFILPGMTVVCGDSHTATHGAFGSLAFGIGTSEVEHVFATQTILQKRAKNMRITVNGLLCLGVSAKDLILKIIGAIGTSGGTGHVIEFSGSAISALSMEGRMTICNMAIEAGARAGLIAPDATTFNYVKGRPMSPSGDVFEKAVSYWETLKSDDGAHYDKEVIIDAKSICPMVTWGTSPEDVVAIDGVVPLLLDAPSDAKRTAMKRAYDYMGLVEGQRIVDIEIDKVFIGSCTNSRIEDLRLVASVVEGKRVKDGIYAMIVPGSGLVKQMAEDEGLDKIFKSAGFDWRDAGCSMCLGMNEDRLKPKERCAATSNRNFEGRQGAGGRTHLMSPPMAAIAAITGKLTDIRDFL